MSKRILITGASGFIGVRLVASLREDNFKIRGLCRQLPGYPGSEGIDWQRVNLLSKGSDLSRLCDDCQYIIHLAGKAHDSRAETGIFYSTNYNLTERMAKAAAAAGAEQFVFLSTIKVHGEGTQSGNTSGLRGYAESSPPAPQDAYSSSKWAAEQALKEVCSQSDMAYTILRPPLVFGPGVKANFLALMKVVKSGIPLPLLSIENARSMIFVDNLCDLIVKCLHSPAARNQTFVVADSCLSTPDLVRNIAKGLGVRPRLFSLPLPLLRLTGRITGRGEMIDRLTQSLVVDDSVVRQRLDWQPPVSLEEGMRETAEWFLENNRG